MPFILRYNLPRRPSSKEYYFITLFPGVLCYLQSILSLLLEILEPKITDLVFRLQYLKPIFCHWAGDGAQNPSTASTTITSDAGRKRAAPHIKSYIRFGDKSQSSIDWVLVTSANLSKQAWGEGTNTAGEIRICSYEIGVLVWPELYGDDATMIPTFKTDWPASDLKTKNKLVVGARMPYDLPLIPYTKSDIPWCASASYTEPDVCAIQTVVLKKS